MNCERCHYKFVSSDEVFSLKLLEKDPWTDYTLERKLALCRQCAEYIWRLAQIKE